MVSRGAATGLSLHYLFDPLCGWCYGAAPMIESLAVHLQGVPDAGLSLVPTGLFSGSGARRMDAGFADYAWANDVRIEQLTGQRFSERYRREVLGQIGASFDAGPAYLALSAVALTAPERELEALRHIQQARYIEGRDITTRPPLVELLHAHGLRAAAERLQAADAELLALESQRREQSQALMRELGLHSVPALVCETPEGRRVIRGQALYGEFSELLAELGLAQA